MVVDELPLLALEILSAHGVNVQGYMLYCSYMRPKGPQRSESITRSITMVPSLLPTESPLEHPI